MSGTNNSGFLTTPVKNLFLFDSSEVNINAESCLSDNAEIKVTVSSGGKKYVYSDWTIDKVDRPSNDFSSFKATYTSKSAKKCEWTADSTVEVEITNGQYSNSTPLVLRFKVCNYKEKKFIIPASFDFEQVK